MSVFISSCGGSSKNVNADALVFNSESLIDVEENTLFIANISSTHPATNTVSYQLTGGDDQSLLSIDSESGALSFLLAPDYENPNDADENNRYQIQVQASAIDTPSVTQVMTITVLNQNDLAPTINLGDTISIEENSTTVTTVIAFDLDGDSLSYSLSGGVDQSLFSIHTESGILLFNTAPDYESPNDSDGNNTYQLEITLSDSIHSIIHDFQITILDQDDSISGLSVRPTNNSCVITTTPNLSSDIQLTRVFPNLSFFKPVALRQSANQRWYVAEQGGTIRSFLDGDNTTTLVADFGSRISTGSEKGLLGLDFHPDFSTNGFIFIYYSVSGGPDDHQSVISRFNITNELILDFDSELEIMRIDQPYSNHNGGNILFGPDGYLYIGLGDGGSSGDPENYAQNPLSLLGKMLRIDIDTPANGNNYSIPLDNPYVNTSTLDETFALGLRNPWRWSFDRVTGDIYVGDVGQNNWEEIDIVKKGGNYGWRCYEGNNVFNTFECQSQEDYDAPIYEYNRNQGFSVTGGYVYRGNAIPALYGTYLFSDYGSGPIWGISDPSGTNPVTEELISASFFISSFAEDNQGELYALDFSNGFIHRIDAASESVDDTFPDQLSETGCIDSDNPLAMASGLIPYDINAKFWSDGAVKERWMALPNDGQISVETNGDWTFPPNSVLVKNFLLDDRRIETRLLARHADGSWGGYSYEWNESETDATLLLNGKTIIKENQTYIFPSSTDCMICHTTVAGITLGPETQQLNKSLLYDTTGIHANQLFTLNSIDLFTSSLTDIGNNLDRLTDPDDISASIHDRARAYLHTNCAQCHQSSGPTNVDLDFHINTPDSNMNICNVNPTHLMGEARAIMSPGDALNSTMIKRLDCRAGVSGCNEGDEMPPLGSALVDDDGVEIVSLWIDSLSECP